MLLQHRRSQAEPRPRAHRAHRAHRAQRKILVPTLLLALLTPLADRAAQAAGSFPLSSCPDCDHRGSGAVAGNPQGAFFTAWTGSTTTAAPAVLGRFFKPDGTARGTDVVLSPAASFSGGDAAVAAEGSGFFAAAWSRKDGLNSEVLVQRFKRTTAPLGGAIQVSLDEPGTIRLDFAPVIVFLNDGSFLVAWERYGPQVQGSAVLPVQVMARRFAWKTGKPFGPPQKISDSLVADGRVALCATRGGAIGAAWISQKESAPFQASLLGAVFRRLTPNGQPFGSEVALAAPASTVGGVALACSGSSFTATWRSNHAPAAGPSILVRRIGTNGALGETVVISNAAKLVSPPAAFDDAHGNTVVAWMAKHESSMQVRFRRIDAAGTLGAETPVSTVTSLGSPPAPALSAIGKAGDFVLVWSGEGLFGRRISASGVPLASGATAADLDPPSAGER